MSQQIVIAGPGVPQALGVGDSPAFASVFASSRLARTAPSTDKWIIFGDSMSDSLTLDYPAFVINDLKVTGTVTHAVSGHRIDNQLATLDVLLAGDANALDGFDMLSLLVGVNDFQSSTDIGFRTDTAATATYAGFLMDFIETALTANPNIKMYIMTPMETDSIGAPYNSTSTLGWTLRDLSVLISQIGSDYGVQVIDLYSLSQFNQQTIATYTTDGLHPNTVGGDIIGKVISEAFSSPIVHGKLIDSSTPTAFGKPISLADGSIAAPSYTFSSNKTVGMSLINSNIEIISSDYTLLGDAAGNILFGKSALSSVTTGTNNAAFGTNALTLLTSGINNFALGASALGAAITASENVAIGVAALSANQTASNNVAIGTNALGAATSANNTAVGSQALKVATSAADNTAIGKSSLTSATTGGGNVAVGANSLFANTTGSDSVAIGLNSAQSNLSGPQNVSIGALSLATNTANGRNTAIGWHTLFLSTGFSNTALGWACGDNITSGSNKTVIGGNALDAQSATASNTLNLMNGVFGTGMAGSGTTISAGRIGVFEPAPSASHHVNQRSTTAAIPVQALEQLDIDDSFINFIGTSAADSSRSVSSSTATASAKFGAVKIEINGVAKWLRVYDSAV